MSDDGGLKPAPMFDIRDLLERSREPVELDGIDRQLLFLLGEDSSISRRSLAAKIGMSAPAVADRIARLERANVIKRHTIEVDWAAIGYPMLIIIPIKFSASANVLDVVTALREIPELVEIVVLTGTYDMMARFRVRDHSDLQQLMLEKVWPIPGLQRVETMLSLGRIADTSPLAKVFAADGTSGPRSAQPA
jgi:Lrp/AsnC family transcriptional regulator for asnA, asnC and gidA